MADKVNDWSKLIKKAANKGLKAATKAVENIDINDVAKAAQKGLDKATDAMNNIDLNDVAKAAKKGANAAVGAVNNVVQDIKDIDFKELGNNLSDKAKDLLKEKEKEIEANKKLVSGRGAAKIMYYIMAADGEVYHDEEDKYNDICRELYKNFDDDKDNIRKECSNQLEKVIDTEDYYDVMTEGMADAIADSQDKVKVGIPPKLLLWNLLAVAYSDEQYSESERKLIKYVSRKLDISKTVFLEMENCMLTLIALEEEEAWIKATDRPYLQIEKEVKEIEERKATVMESVNNLISL